MNLRDAWNDETSALPSEWSKLNPARGQCAVSALVVQDTLGGDLLRTTVNGESHYLNRLPDGSVIDVTFDQFPIGTIYDNAPVVRERSYVLSFPATVTRYRLLQKRMQLC